jgi:antirestriction protein ArdC
MQTTEKQDIYTRITNQIVSHLEKGVRPWVRPWNAEHAAGRLTRQLRHNGKPYSGINVLSLWASAIAQNFAAPIWMTFKQASELDAHIRKGEKGSLVVYADSIRRKKPTKRRATKSTGKSSSLRGTPFSMSSRSKACRKFITRKPHLTRTLWPASITQRSSSQPWEQRSDTAEIVRFTALPPM